MQHFPATLDYKRVAILPLQTFYFPGPLETMVWICSYGILCRSQTWGVSIAFYSITLQQQHHPVMRIFWNHIWNTEYRVDSVCQRLKLYIVETLIFPYIFIFSPYLFLMNPCQSPIVLGRHWPKASEPLRWEAANRAVELSPQGNGSSFREMVNPPLRWAMDGPWMAMVSPKIWLHFMG